MVNVLRKDLNGLILIKPVRHSDERGFFEELYNFDHYKSLSISEIFVQDNNSLSKAPGTLRGLHFQGSPRAQAKLVRCGAGRIFDVAVDIRSGSPTFGKWKGFELSAENRHQLYLPAGFAHGFVTMEPNSEIIYKCSDVYAPEVEGAIRWNDPEIGIEWPLAAAPVLSEKDAAAPLLSDIISPFTWTNS